jgi:hypothetical protein
MEQWVAQPRSKGKYKFLMYLKVNPNWGFFTGEGPVSFAPGFDSEEYHLCGFLFCYFIFPQ